MKNHDSNMEIRRHEMLEDVQAHTQQILVDHGIKKELAEQAGCAICDRLADNWGGQVITFPKDHRFRLSKRDIEIYKEFNGRNHNELAKRYRVTTRAIYKIIQRVRDRMDSNQACLF